MAKVSTERIELKGSQSKEDYHAYDLSFKYDIYVNRDGIFSTTLPANIVALFKDANVDVGKNRIGNEGYISRDTLPKLKQAVKDIATEYLSRDLIDERIVIRYAIRTDCSYCMNKKGDIFPNGSFGEYTGDEWRYGTVMQHASNRGPYGIQVYVESFHRKEYRYRSGKTKVEYDRTRDSDPKYLHLIESFTVMENTFNGDEKEIDYTEPVAAFFYNMLMSLARLNEKIINFLEPDAIMKLANSNFKLLE